jgi:ATP-dependent RNA helicase DDX10/DBP4
MLWATQMDCPEDVATYIHRVGRTARYTASGRSLLFLVPSEEKYLSQLEAAKIPVSVIKVPAILFCFKVTKISH